MAYRGNQLEGGAAYPNGGSIRGGSKYKDWYYMSGIRVTIALNDGMPGFRRHSGVIDCPKKVY